MAKLRIEKPIGKRYGLGYAARRAAKRADRATFRQQAGTSFQQISIGLNTLDRALVGIFEQFVSFKVLQYALDIAFVAAILLGSKVLAVGYVAAGTVLAFLPLGYYVYQIRKRAAAAREAALLAALEQQRRNGVAPPPQQPVVQPEVTSEAGA